MRTSETRGNIKREARSRSLVFNVAGVFSLVMKLKREGQKFPKRRLESELAS